MWHRRDSEHFRKSRRVDMRANMVPTVARLAQPHVAVCRTVRKERLVRDFEGAPMYVEMTGTNVF
eukprot:scaffold656_cov403-Pavlova_lutheri.AAC.59